MPQRAINENLFHHFDPRSGAETLEQILVQQPGADQLGIEGRHVTKVIVVEIDSTRGWGWMRKVRKLRLSPGPGAGTAGFPAGLSACRDW